MPPSRYAQPALEVARPRDTTPGPDHGHVSSRETWACLFTDGQWRNVGVRAWWYDDSGRLVVSLAWSGPDGLMAEDYLDDPERLEDPDPGEPTACPRPADGRSPGGDAG